MEFVLVFEVLDHHEDRTAKNRCRHRNHGLFLHVSLDVRNRNRHCERREDQHECIDESHFPIQRCCTFGEHRWIHIVVNCVAHEDPAEHEDLCKHEQPNTFFTAQVLLSRILKVMCDVS
ncbi:hypothetical protein D3C87_1123620 [compost metagenome]